MAAARFYSSVVGALDLTGSISNSATSMTVNTTSGLPGTTPFTLVIDPGAATEEIVDVTNVSGLTLTVTRGVDGSAAQAHSAGVGNVRHMATARDFREPQEHIGGSADVHGVGSTSSVVGTETAQTLKNKTAAAATAGTPALIVKGAASQSANILDVQNSTGGSVVSVRPAEGSLSIGTVQAKINSDGASSLFGYIAKFTTDAAGSVAGIFKAAASQTADILQVQSSSGSVLAKFDKDGKFTAPQVTSTGLVTGSNIQQALVSQVTSNVGSITTTETTLATSPSVTGDGVKRFKITASLGALTGSIAGDIFTLRIKADGGQIRSGLATITSNFTCDAKALVVTHVPAAGSHTYTFTATRSAGSGTGTALGSSVDPIEITVEQIA